MNLFRRVEGLRWINTNVRKGVFLKLSLSLNLYLNLFTPLKSHLKELRVNSCQQVVLIAVYCTKVLFDFQIESRV